MGGAPEKSMTSIAQLEANFLNSQYSTGPRTEKGKHRTRLNAYRHGLTGQLQLFTAEDHAAFEQHCVGILESLAPVGALEIDLAQSIAKDRWRLNRAWTLETSIFALGQTNHLGNGTPGREDPVELLTDQAHSQAHTWLTKGENIQLLALYEQRIQRSLEKKMAEFRTLRAERLAARRQALEEAQLVPQPKPTPKAPQKLPPAKAVAKPAQTPAKLQNGSVFSSPVGQSLPPDETAPTTGPQAG